MPERPLTGRRPSCSFSPNRWVFSTQLSQGDLVNRTNRFPTIAFPFFWGIKIPALIAVPLDEQESTKVQYDFLKHRHVALDISSHNFEVFVGAFQLLQ